MAADERASAVLHDLRSLGVRIALDDFGTGYSSLSYLRHFPFDKLKIDRSFLSGGSKTEAAFIVRAVAALGRGLGMIVTAEGVETQEQYDVARAEGCMKVQRYLIGNPAQAKNSGSSCAEALWRDCSNPVVDHEMSADVELSPCINPKPLNHSHVA